MWLVPLLVLAWITKINSNKWQMGPCLLQIRRWTELDAPLRVLEVISPWWIWSDITSEFHLAAKVALPAVELWARFIPDELRGLVQAVVGVGVWPRRGWRCQRHLPHRRWGERARSTLPGSFSVRIGALWCGGSSNSPCTRGCGKGGS
jgi:hypothetical protein